MAVVEVEATARSCEGGHLGRPLLEARQPAEGAEAHVDDVEGPVNECPGSVLDGRADERRPLGKPGPGRLSIHRSTS
jgi:hypothetical protein